VPFSTRTGIRPSSASALGMDAWTSLYPGSWPRTQSKSSHSHCTALVGPRPTL
jgi:hypothetical protein